MWFCRAIARSLSPRSSLNVTSAFNDYTEHGGAFLPLTTRRAPLTFLFLYTHHTEERRNKKREFKEERLEGDKEGIKRRRTYVFERVSELVLPEPCFGWILCFKKEEFWVETPLLEAKKRKKTDHSWGLNERTDVEKRGEKRDWGVLFLFLRTKTLRVSLRIPRSLLCFFKASSLPFSPNT